MNAWRMILPCKSSYCLPRSYLWEILHVTLNKVINRAQHVQTKLDGFRDVYNKNEVIRDENPSAECTLISYACVHKIHLTNQDNS